MTEYEHKQNVLLIVMDAVRADHLSIYGYEKNTTPNLVRISKDSTIFSNAISSGPWSLPSISSLFTGLYPMEHGATWENLNLTKKYKTLAEILSQNGYRTLAISENPWINDSTGLSRGFEHFVSWENVYLQTFRFWNSLPKIFRRKPIQKIFQALSYVYSKYFKRQNDMVSVTQNYLHKFVKRSKKSPFFIFLNFLDVHLPYDAPDKFKVFLSEKEKDYARSNRLGDKEIIFKKRLKFWAKTEDISEEEFDVLKKLYDCAILYTDFWIGELVDCLRKSGELENTLIIITADHGENIGDHNLLGHQLCLYDTLVKVPLLIRYPKLFPKNTRIEKQVETKDIFFTILNALGLEKTADCLKSRRSLNNVLNEPDERIAFGEYANPENMLKQNMSQSDFNSIKNNKKYSSESKFIRKDCFKYIWYESAEDELYDLEKDPREENNIWLKNPEKSAEMKRILLEKMKNVKEGSQEEKREMNDVDEDIKKRLHDLGYF